MFTHTKGIWEKAWKNNLQKKKQRADKKKELTIIEVKAPIKLRGLSEDDTDVQSTGGRLNHDDYGLDMDADELNWSQIFELKDQVPLKKIEPQPPASKVEPPKEGGENPEVKAQ